MNGKAGDYVKIDLNMTEIESSLYTLAFKSKDVCLPARTDSNGRIVRDLLEFARNVGEEHIGESQRYAASVEQSGRYANNHA